MAPPPRDGLLYRDAGDGDHVVSHLPHLPNEDIVRDPAITVIPSDGGWVVAVAWVAKVHGIDMLMYATLTPDAFSWLDHKPIWTLGGLNVESMVWIVDGALKRNILMFNALPQKHPEVTKVMWLHTFAGFEAASSKKKATGWSHLQNMPSLQDCQLSGPPLRGLKSGLILPVHNSSAGIDMLKWSLLEDASEGVRWAQGVSMTGQFSDKARHPTVVRLLDSRAHPSRYLVAFFQSRGKTHIWRSVSNNDGRSWAPAERTLLPNPDTQVQAITLQSGAIVLMFHNNHGDAERGDNKHWPLSLTLSEDGGVTWPWVRDVLGDFDPRLKYTSPSLAQSPDGQIHIVFSVPHMKTIRYQQVSERWIKGRYAWGATRGVYVCGESGKSTCWTQQTQTQITH
mmetsp:Transcript_8102/g.20762  ORF Transcript_8102/g.20762 Transcript_8102/m.20762 type:complete len:396 (-) Transcript_8102:43-1230(-)